LMRN